MADPLARRVERLESARTKADTAGPPLILGWLVCDEEADVVAGWYSWPLSRPLIYWTRNASESLDRFEARVAGQALALKLACRQGGRGTIIVESHSDFLCRLSGRFPSWLRGSGCVFVESGESVEGDVMPPFPPAAGTLLGAAGIPADVNEVIKSTRTADVAALLHRFAQPAG